MKSFYKNHGPFDVNKIVSNLIFSEKKKFPKSKIKNITTLSEAKKGDLTFYDNRKYLNYLKKTNASFCLIKPNNVKLIENKKTIPILSEQPLLDFIIVTKLFYPDAVLDKPDFPKKKKKILKKNSILEKNAKIGKDFNIGYNSVIKNNVIIGNNVSIGSNCSISNCIIGNNVFINDNTVIGKVGFGYKYIKNQLHYIPHLGRVIVGNDVYIGSFCSIDRGSFTDTIIGDSSQIDNQVHIAHNVKIGSFCNIAAQVGIAGSTKIGSNCMIGGQAGISGHLDIGRNVFIGGKSGVIKNISDGSKVMGYPATKLREFLKKNDR